MKRPRFQISAFLLAVSVCFCPAAACSFNQPGDAGRQTHRRAHRRCPQPCLHSHRRGSRAVHRRSRAGRRSGHRSFGLHGAAGTDRRPWAHPLQSHLAELRHPPAHLDSAGDRVGRLQPAPLARSRLYLGARRLRGAGGLSPVRAARLGQARAHPGSAHHRRGQLHLGYRRSRRRLALSRRSAICRAARTWPTRSTTSITWCGATSSMAPTGSS